MLKIKKDIGAVKSLIKVRNFASFVSGLDRNVKLICVAGFLFTFGDGLYTFVLPVYIRQLNALPSEVGLLYALSNLSCGVTILLGGYLSSHVDTKKIIIASSLLWLPMPLALAAASNWTQLFIPMVLYGSYLGLPAICFYLIKSTPADKRMQAFGMWSASTSIGYIFSPFIGGSIVSTIGKQAVFLIAFAIYASSIGPLILINKQPRKTEVAPVQSETTFANKANIILLSTVFSIAMFFIFLLYPLIPQFTNGVYHQSVFNLGIFGMTTFAGWAFFSFLFGKIGDKFSQVKAFTAALAMSSFSFLLILLLNNFIFLAFASFLSGASYTVLYLVPGIIGSNSPEQSMTKWVSISQASVSLLAGAAPILGGMLYELSPYTPFFITIFVLFFLAIIALTIKL